VKTLVLIRHAHRDTSDRDADDGLSDKGRAQALALAAHYRTHYFETAEKLGVTIRSSRRKRCVETVEPIARLHGRKVETFLPLLEQESGETELVFVERVLEFVRWWKEDAPNFVVACSHGDWLPLVTEKLIGRPMDFKKGALAEIVLKSADARPSLRSLMQEL